MNTMLTWQRLRELITRLQKINHFFYQSDGQIGLTAPLLIILTVSEDFSLFAYSEKNLEIHECQSQEWQNSGGESGVPDQRESVPEYEGWILPGLAWIHNIGSIGLSDCDLHELGNVERERQNSHRNNIDQQSLGIGHSLERVSGQ